MENTINKAAGQVNNPCRQGDDRKLVRDIPILQIPDRLYEKPYKMKPPRSKLRGGFIGSFGNTAYPLQEQCSDSVGCFHGQGNLDSFFVVVSHIVS